MYNVKPAKEVWLNDSLLALYRDNNPVIRYLVNGSYKIYQPLNKNCKWVSNCRINAIQGLKQLPKSGNLLIISKAMKDCMVWRELGYNAIALSSETAKMPKEIIEHLRGRFKKVVSFLDNDNAGLTTMNSYWEQHQIPFTHIPVDMGVKDLSDFVEAYGLDGAEELLNQLNFN